MIIIGKKQDSGKIYFNRCPCSDQDFEHCCGRFLQLGQLAPNALLLMRSRYTAYVLQDLNYLKKTWHPDTLPSDIDQLFNEVTTRWLGLTIQSYQVSDATHAKVEFIARYKIAGRAYRLHEESCFEWRADNAWYYVDGEQKG